MKNLKAILGLSLLVLISACTKEVKQNNRPDWIDKPDGYFVGKCASHVKDLTAQEQCAYREGLAYISMSKGFSVDASSQKTIKQSATEKTGSSYGQVQAVVNKDEKTIKVSGSIIDKWHDKVSDIMYVLIKEN